MPHVPLKVLRGQQDEEDQNYTVPPGTSTEEEAERAAADDSTSHSSHEDITSDVGEVSEEGMERYLGRHTGAMHGANQIDDHFGEIQNYQNESTPEYDTTGSVNQQASQVQVAAQVHHIPNRDESEDDYQMTIGRLSYLKSEAILMTDKQLNQVDLDLPESGFVSILYRM